jgi:hypothetical protein
MAQTKEYTIYSFEELDAKALIDVGRWLMRHGM